MQYEFLIAEQPSEQVQHAFPELHITTGPVGGTALYGPVRDASELQGLLARFAQFGTTVVEMRQLPD